MSVRILQGDAREVLRTLPEQSVQMCVTSPPYFGLRDYGVAGQMGLEATPDEFIAGMVDVFREVRRVLSDDGTLWLNIGDSYNASPAGNKTPSGFSQTRPSRRTGNGDQETVHTGRKLAGGGIKAKDLIGIPWMLAFALRADGWYLRQDIIWSKPNPMPESVRDRCTKAHEYVFLLSKSERYYYDCEAIKEQAIYGNEAEWAGDAPGLHSGEAHAGSGKSTRRFAKGVAGWATGPGDHSVLDHNQDGRSTHAEQVKNNGVGFGHGYDKDLKPRTVGRKRGVPPRHAEFESSDRSGLDDVGRGMLRNRRSVWTVPTHPYKEAHFATYPPALIEPCIKAGCPEGGTVLDPFFGAGTTGLVADRLQRNCIGIELNAEYAAIAHRRITGDSPMFAEVANA